MKLLIFCPDCGQENEFTKTCPIQTSLVEGYKGNMHWYQAKYVSEVKQTTLEM